MADQVLRSIKTDQRAVLLPIGRSPFWITAAIKLFPLPDSLKVIPLSFSQSKNNHVQENEYSSDQLRGYLKYLSDNLKRVNSTDNIYILDYCASGLTAIEIWRMLDAYYAPPPREFNADGLELSTIKERVHFIALKNSAISLPLDHLAVSHLSQIYASVTNIELPSLLKHLLVQKDPFYRFLEIPYLGFYPIDWGSYKTEREPNKAITVKSKIPTVRLEQLESFRNKKDNLLYHEKNS